MLDIIIIKNKEISNANKCVKKKKKKQTTFLKWIKT